MRTLPSATVNLPARSLEFSFSMSPLPWHHAASEYWEIIANRLHAQGWSYCIAEHFTKHGLSFASMRTAMENDSSLRPMIC